MAVQGRHQSLRLLAGVAAVALFVGPAGAFFCPGKTAITVPTYPVNKGGGTTGGTTTGGTTGTPESAPEPTSLVLALLGSGGASLFVACRRRRHPCRRKLARAATL